MSSKSAGDENGNDRLQRQACAICIALAIVCWLGRDFFPSFAAREYSANAEVTTTQERTDERVLRAFDKAKRAAHLPSKDVAMTTEPPSDDIIRDSTVTVKASSEDAVVALLHTTTEAIRIAFEGEGPGAFQVNERRTATPIGNDTTVLLERTLRGLCLAFLLLGTAIGFLAWRRAGKPKSAILIPIALCIPVVLSLIESLGESGILTLIVMPIPLLITALVVKKSLDVKRAAKWTTGSATITGNGIEAVKIGIGENQTVKNKAVVNYQFKALEKSYRGSRIGIGEYPDDAIDVTLKKYAVGTTVPVYYDPEDPNNCVLERDPPASIGCLIGGSAAVLAIGIAIVVFFSHGSEIDSWLANRFPSLGHPLMGACVGAMGLFCLAMYVVGRRRMRKIERWPITKGTIVASRVEAFRETMRATSSRTTKLYQPVVEYRYRVAGNEYHGSQIRFGVKVATGTKTLAESIVEKYPVDAEVDVHHDPEDVTQAVLEIGFAGAGCLLLLALGLLALAFFVATHV